MEVSPFDKRRGGAIIRSLSPSGRFPATPTAAPSSSAFASSTSYSFSSTQATFFADSVHRSGSPTRVNVYNSSPSHSPSFKFSLNRAISPSRSISVTKQTNQFPKKTCMCSPTTHPGSFRCSLHKNAGHGRSVPSAPMRLNMMRSAMKNSLVRIGGVEGEWVKRALTALIRPSSHQQRRRADFKPCKSRLSVMHCAGGS